MSDVTKDDLREVADEIRNKLDAMTAERDKWKTAYGEIETKLHEEAKLVDETRAERDAALAEVKALREKCAGVADEVAARAADNTNHVREANPNLSLDKLKEIHNQLSGQRHAAVEIAKKIRALAALDAKGKADG